LDVLDKITAVVLDFNLRSIKFHERVGFKREKECDGQIFFVKERL
jgi:RimJ/RimL family protein N-acetyltransferase